MSQFILYTYQTDEGRQACHAYGSDDKVAAEAEGAKLQGEFHPAQPGSAVFTYSVLPFAGDQSGPWVVFTSVSGFGAPDQHATGFADELGAYKAALDFAAGGGMCRIDGATCMVLALETMPS